MIEFEYIEKSRISEYKRYYDYTDALGCEESTGLKSAFTAIL